MLRKYTALTIVCVQLLALFGCAAPGSGTPDSDMQDTDVPPSDAQPPDTLPEDTPASSSSMPADLTAGFKDITAAEWVGGIRMGWNLGNTFDAHAGHGANGFSWLGGGLYASTSVSQMESAWVNQTVKKELIDALCAAGFNAIRIPVTWHKAVDEALRIREDWMSRITEVVGWAMDNGMYVILNTHHDESLFKFMDKDTDESVKAFAGIWEQIAANFRDFGEKLAFEGLNEPRTPGSGKEWSGGTPEEHENINKHNQIFVDTVRASGGNNTRRVLILTTYAASAEAAAQRALTIPDDSAAGKLAVSIHMYSPWEFALRTGETGVRDEWDKTSTRDTDPITKPLELAHELFVSNGYPVIIGEMGVLNRDNIEARAEWTEFYVSYAKSLGMPCFWWDNGMTGVTAPNQWGGWDETFGIISRATAEIAHPEIVDALLRATG